jgi:sugar phosphate isomerase/epimerase
LTLPIFMNAPYGLVKENIQRILSLRIGIEVYFNNNALDEAQTKDVKELGKMLGELGIQCTVHAPFMDLSPGGYDRTVRTITKDKLKRSVEFANLLHALSVVCHPGYDRWRYDGNQKLWLDASIDTWTEVIGEADKNLMVLLENIFEDEPSTLIELFRNFQGKNLNFCFDSGHFNLFSRTPINDWLAPLKGRIREMHLHDNHGKSDEHLPIGMGTFPFRELKAFVQQLDNIIYTIEIHRESYTKDSIKNLKEFLS